MKTTDSTPLFVWLERIAWSAGCVLIVYYLLSDWQSQQAREQSVQQFETELVVNSSAQKTARQIQEISQESTTQAALAFGIDRDAEIEVNSVDAQVAVSEKEHIATRPNMSLWSKTATDTYLELTSKAQNLPSAKALLSIPKIEVKVPIYDNASDYHLDIGVARVAGTGSFMFFDNLAIAGHRDSFFRRLGELSENDDIHIQLANGNVKTFNVSSIDIVAPNDISVLAPSDDESITLVTCYPFYFLGNAPKRYIVKAVMR